MNNIKTISISFGIILLNEIIGHLFAPNGIMLTPIVLILISVFIGFVNDELKPIWKSVLLAVLIGLHDIGIKLYSGGRHDPEGLGWVHLMLFIGLMPAYGILIAGIFKSKNESKQNKLIAVIIFPLMIWIHLLIFGKIGLGRCYCYDWNG